MSFCDKFKSFIGKRDLSSEDRLKKHIAKNSKYLIKIRKSLESLKSRNLDSYLSTFSIPLEQIIENYKKVAEYAINKKVKNISSLIKFCNHRNFILAVKTQLKNVTIEVEEDFVRLNNFIALPYEIDNDNKENQKFILAQIIVIVKIFDNSLDKIKKIELELLATASEFEDLKNPGTMRKVIRVFSNKDKERILEIGNHWKLYYNEWNNMHSVLSSSIIELRDVLSIYLQKLFVYTPIEHMNSQMLIARFPIKYNAKRFVKTIKTL